jgi:hypothetical protein
MIPVIAALLLFSCGGKKQPERVVFFTGSWEEALEAAEAAGEDATATRELLKKIRAARPATDVR